MPVALRAAGIFFVRNVTSLLPYLISGKQKRSYPYCTKTGLYELL